MSDRRRRCTTARRWFALLILAHAAGSTLLAGGERIAAARSSRRVDKDAVLATERLEKGKQALAASDYATAYSEMTAAYRLAPSALALLALGQLAQREGRLLQAQDLMRRYLTEAGVEAPPDVAAVLAQPSPPFAEVKVLGPRGAMVSVDERLVGSLPLTRSLLLGEGRHAIALELQPRRRALVGQRIEGAVSVRPGRRMEVRFDERSDVMFVSMRPAVLTLMQLGGLSAKADEELRRAVSEELRRARLDPVALEDKGALAAELARCQADPVCQARRAEKEQTEYALRLQVQGGDAWRFSAQLLDVAIREVAQESSGACAGCDADRALGEIVALLRRTVREGIERPRGDLEITSVPAGAQVRIDGRTMGQTPLARPGFAGSHQIELVLEGFLPARATLAIPTNEIAKQSFTLERDPSLAPEPPPGGTPAAAPYLAVLPETGPAERTPRPLWRLAAGGATLGVGALIGGFGVSALIADGDCTSPVVPPARACGYRFDTRNTGGALLGVGLAVSAAGAILIALPGRWRRASPRPTPVSSAPR